MNTAKNGTIRAKRKKLETLEVKAEKTMEKSGRSRNKTLAAVERKREKLTLQCERLGNHGPKTLIGGCALCGWSGSPA